MKSLMRTRILVCLTLSMMTSMVFADPGDFRWHGHEHEHGPFVPPPRIITTTQAMWWKDYHPVTGLSCSPA